MRGDQGCGPVAAQGASRHEPSPSYGLVPQDGQPGFGDAGADHNLDLSVPIAHQLSSSYDMLKVIGVMEGKEVAVARAALHASAQQMLSNGMRLLGLDTVER